MANQLVQHPARSVLCWLHPPSDLSSKDSALLQCLISTCVKPIRCKSLSSKTLRWPIQKSQRRYLYLSSSHMSCWMLWPGLVQSRCVGNFNLKTCDTKDLLSWNLTLGPFNISPMYSLLRQFGIAMLGNRGPAAVREFWEYCLTLPDWSGHPSFVDNKVDKSSDKPSWKLKHTLCDEKKWFWWKDFHFKVWIPLRLHSVYVPYGRSWILSGLGIQRLVCLKSADFWGCA